MGDKALKVGFVGCPPHDIMREYEYAQFIDLDNDLGPVEEKSDIYLPKISCSVIKRIFNNALAIRPQKIIDLLNTMLLSLSCGFVQELEPYPVSCETWLVVSYDVYPVERILTE